MKLRQFSVATVNLYNLQLPGAAMNPNQRPWTTAEFDAKVTWLAARLTALDADVVGLQELWHRDAMVAVLRAAGLSDTYDLLADPATGDRIVCAALVRTWTAARHAAVGGPVPRRRAPGVDRRRGPAGPGDRHHDPRVLPARAQLPGRAA